MAQPLGGQVDALMRALRAFDPGEYSGEECAKLVKTFTRAEKALAAARTLAAARAAGDTAAAAQQSARSAE